VHWLRWRRECCVRACRWRLAEAGGCGGSGGVRSVLKGLVWLPFYRARAPGAGRLDVVFIGDFCGLWRNNSRKEHTEGSQQVSVDRMCSG
jgi:hypothetical protein